MKITKHKPEVANYSKKPTVLGYLLPVVFVLNSVISTLMIYAITNPGTTLGLEPGLLGTAIIYTLLYRFHFLAAGILILVIYSVLKQKPPFSMMTKRQSQASVTTMMIDCLFIVWYLITVQVVLL